VQVSYLYLVEMLTQEAQGNHRELTLLMVHGQEHLMTGIALRIWQKKSSIFTR